MHISLGLLIISFIISEKHPICAFLLFLAGIGWINI